ncbi:MAG: hypothetical protein A2Y23_04115 [Clostridiales bacterium GWB2_37_7]|nr:MAG: hypothetical protein A2Y23_04115 [Clostridiales bacterium GWB2_37_7]
MNSHGDNNEKQDSHKHSSLKHALHMGLCCGLPIVIIASLPFIARYSPATSGILGLIAPFLCPIIMLFMLPMMFKRDKKESFCDHKKENQDDNQILELNKSAE